MRTPEGYELAKLIPNLPRFFDRSSDKGQALYEIVLVVMSYW
jgi:hypothetical protein